MDRTIDARLARLDKKDPGKVTGRNMFIAECAERVIDGQIASIDAMQNSLRNASLEWPDLPAWSKLYYESRARHLVIVPQR